jgi:hypothetical protein
MKRASSIGILVVGSLLLIASPAAADTLLELGLGFTPTVVGDAGYEAVSEDDLAALRAGADIRFDVIKLGRGLHLLPLIGYRIGVDEGQPYYIMDTSIVTNDFVAGLRFRAWLLSWFGLFAEAHGGLLWARLRGDVDRDDDGYDYAEQAGARDEYLDDQLTWTVGALGGVEVRIAPRWLERRGITWFDVGAEVGAGYIWRGALEFEPELSGGDEHSLAVGQTADWGDLNLSGWFFQIGVTFSFL